MTDDCGATALAERIRLIVSSEAKFNPAWPEGWAKRSAAAILGEHGRFLPDGRRWDDLVEVVTNMRLAAIERKAEVERLRAAGDSLVNAITLWRSHDEADFPLAEWRAFTKLLRA